jgi:tRNA (guanine-N7-)-methyltransferase
LPQFGIPYSTQPLDLSAVFGMNSPKILEIGFGMGESTAAPHAD